MKLRTIPLLVLPLMLFCLLASLASAGEATKAVPLFSDRKGDAGWIEMDRVSGRMRATPYLRLSGETVDRAEETAGRAGEARVTRAADAPKPDPSDGTDRKMQKRKVLSSLLNGSGGISLGKVLDLARQATDSARERFRTQASPENQPPVEPSAAR